MNSSICRIGRAAADAASPRLLILLLGYLEKLSMTCLRIRAKWLVAVALVYVGLAAVSAPHAQAADFLWNGTAGTAELWSSSSNWLPIGIPSTDDDAIFGSISGALHDIVMPTPRTINLLTMVDGRYEFRRATGSGTPWDLNILRAFPSLPTGLSLAPVANNEIELTLRDGELSVEDLWTIGDGEGSSATVVATDMALSAGILWLARGDDSEVLLRVTDGTFSVGSEVEIGAGGTLEILGDAVATMADDAGESFQVRGDLLVSGELTTRNIQFFDQASVTIAQDGLIDADTFLLAGGTLAVAGSGGGQARLDANDVLGATQTMTVGNLGVIQANASLRVHTLNLQLGGRVQVPASGLDIRDAFNWTGGTLALVNGFRVDDDALNENPLGANVTVASGRTLEVGGLLEVGTENQGALTITSGTATSGSARIGTSGLPTGPATVTMSGSSGSWTVAGNLTVGGVPNLQTATIAISGGADLNVGDAFVAPPGLRADVTVSGAGSTITSTNSIYLGGNAATAGGQGTLALTSGGSLAIGNSSGDVLKVWEGYAVTMNQASISTRDLWVRGTMAPAVGATVPGGIAVQGFTLIDGGSVTLSALSSNFTANDNVTITNGGSLNAYIIGGADTDVTINGGGSTWTTASAVASVLGSTTTGLGRVRSLTLNTGGTANLRGGVSYAATASDGLTMAGGTLNAPTFNAGNIGVTGRGTINANYSSTGAIIPNGPLTIGNSSSTTGFGTTGQIIAFTNPLTLNDADAADIGSATSIGLGTTPGSLTAVNGINLAAGKTLSGFGTVHTNNNAASRLQNLGAINGNSTTDRISLPGYITGNGSFTNVEFTGTLAPSGALPSIPTGLVSGSNYKFTNTSQLLMDIGGASPGFGYDVIFSTGEFIADGTFTVNLISGFNPTLGQSFDLLDFTTLTGTFDTLNLPTLTPGLVWNASQLYTQGRLSIATGFLEADFEEDGDVDGADLTRWRNNYATGTTHMQGDANADGAVNGADFLIWQRQFGLTTSLPATMAIPEPATLAWFSIAFGAIGISRRNRRPY
ncbi:MAG: hypothetical protein C0485_18900 [Pirellula sp.]|nr:hypothetical protein [Pirellula sp.]